jgi:hypothetical protein
MADENRPPDPPQNMRRRRPPTVIDLPATEVPSEFAEPEASVSPPSEPAQPTSSDTPPPPPPEPASAEPEPQPGRRSPLAFLPGQLSWSHAGAAIAGVAGGLIVVLLLWLGGVFSGGREPVVDLSPRLAAIEKQMNELSARPAPSSVDPKAIDDLAARLARLESAQAAPRAPVTDPVVLGRLNAAENATKSLADNAAALSRRAEATDAALREINGRIDKLTATLTDVQTTARSAAAGSDRASRLAVATSALRNAVDHGDPFTAELAIVKPLAPDPNAVALLEPFAASGVPGNAMLGEELAAIVRPMLRAAGDPVRDGGFLDRLQANAEKLVRIRPVGEEARGDDRAAILARVEQRAAQGNISGVLTELAKLPADAREPVQAWIAKTEARNRALDASRRLAADAVAALKTAP